MDTTHGEAVAATVVVAGIDVAIVVEVQVVAIRGRGRTRRPHVTVDARVVERAAIGITITGSTNNE